MGTPQLARGSVQRDGARRIAHWDPEDPRFWEQVGRRVARRNLAFSIFAEHVGFSVWVLWSVVVLFMGPEYGFAAADKFLLVAVPALIGSLLRVPYTLAVALVGGRTWTAVSAALLLIPTVAAALTLRPGVSLPTLLAVAATAGLGGGNFAAPGHVPLLLLGVYIPLIVLAATCAALFMDNLPGVSADLPAARDALSDRHLWLMSTLYLGTFGSFIGYGVAFGLVLQYEFDRTPVQAAAVTFIGPLLGSLIRPIGGRLADRFGGAQVTVWTFLALGAGTGGVILASVLDSLVVFTAGFIAMFVFSGLGNGSTYKMIPTIYRARAEAAVAAGEPAEVVWSRTRRQTGAVIGLVSAIGSLGGVAITLGLRQSFATLGTGLPAFAAFLGFYLVCALLTRVVYLRDFGSGPVAAARTVPDPVGQPRIPDTSEVDGV